MSDESKIRASDEAKMVKLVEELETKSLEHIEFETKYDVEEHHLFTFKQLVDSLPETKSFIYIEGPDYYYTFPEWWFKNNPQWDPSGTFTRYRKPSYGLDNGRRQVTWKYKPIESKNSIQRKELNWDLDEKVTDATVIEQITSSGSTFNFSIIKSCHIYKLADATLVFYTVYDTTDGKAKKKNDFVEIEVNEDMIASLTEEQAWAIIVKYEKILEPIGINAKSRLRLSLFSRYRR
jgi:hypothetical protein